MQSSVSATTASEKSSEKRADTRIGFVGLGALGCVLAFHARRHLAATHCINSAGGRYQGACTRTIRYSKSAPPHTISFKAWQGETLDWLIVTTKAYQTLSALNDVAHALTQVKRVLLIQNGMGQHEQAHLWLKQHAFPCELWVGTSTEGAFKDEGAVHYVGKGHTHIGRYLMEKNTDSDGEYTQKWISATLGDGFRYHHDPVALIRQKLAVNGVINPLTATHRITNGELLTPEFWTETHALCQEISALYQALNWPLPEPLEHTVITVAQHTANNRSSTLQDIEHQRPTELDYITRYLLNQAAQTSVALPHLARLHAALTS